VVKLEDVVKCFECIGSRKRILEDDFQDREEPEDVDEEDLNLLGVLEIFL